MSLHVFSLILKNYFTYYSLFLFNRKDTPAAKIFESMTSEDFKHSIVVTKTAKRLAWLVVFVINIYFVYFSVLRGITRSTSWQVDYLLACILQLFVEIVVYETVECLWIHFTIPKLVSEDIATTMITVKHAINSAFANEKVSAVLDSPKYFFVSRHLAEEFPHLFESSIVLAFQSYFPPGDLDTTSAAHEEKENAADQSDVVQENTDSWGLHYPDIHVQRRKKKSILMAFLQRFNVSVLLMATLQHLGTVPIRFQQLIIHTLQPILFSFLIIFYFFLVKYPMIALCPMAFILYEVLMYAHRSEKGATKSIPAINDAVKNTSSVKAFVADANERSRHQSGAINAVADHDNNDDDGDEKEDDGESQIGRVFTAAGGQREERSCHSDNDGDGDGDGDGDSDSDSDSEGGDSDDYYKRNIEKLMKQSALSHTNQDDASEKNDDNDNAADDNDDDDDDDDGDGGRNGDNKKEEHDKFELNTTVSLSVTEKRLLQLQQKVYEADDAVKHMCVRLGLNVPEDFDFYWEENADEYRFLYQQPITPFVNSHGEQVDRDEMVSMRKAVLIKDEVNMKRNTRLARLGVQRRAQYLFDWDTFRLYDSDLTLSFIDRAGNKVSTQKIEATRLSLYKGVSSVASADSPLAKEFRLLKRTKQVLEHELLVLEEALDLQVDREVGTPRRVVINV